MINVCPQCGLYEVAKEVLPAQSQLVCPQCQVTIPFDFLPLYIVTGSSSVGKTTTALALQKMTHDYIILDQDILWRDEFNTPADGYSGLRSAWLRLIKNINQAGRPVVLFGAAVPEQFELEEARYFSSIHFLALVIDDEYIVQRNTDRPEWRKTQNADYINSHIEFNQWLKTTGPERGVELLDVTNRPMTDIAQDVLHWINNKSGN